MSGVSVGVASAAVGADPEFELRYLDADGRERGLPVEAWPGLRPEGFSPVRRFQWARGQRHLPGWWWSATAGAHVGYESWLERDHLMLLDFDPAVVAFSTQPFWLRWRDGAGQARRHAPDVFIRMADGGAMVLDVRADDRIEARDAEAFEATRQACELAGWRFARVGVVDPVFLANVVWLARYRHWRCGAPEVEELLVKVFTEPVGLRAGAAAVGDPLVVLPVLFHLMWRRVLEADLTVRLTAATVVRAGRPVGGAR